MGLSAYKVDIALRKPGQENWQFALIMDSQRWANLATVTDRELTPLFFGAKAWLDPNYSRLHSAAKLRVLNNMLML